MSGRVEVADAEIVEATYLYGAIVGLQLTAALESAAGGIVDRPEAGALLRERLYAPGQSVRWDRLVERASGMPLAVAPLARAVAKA